MPGPIEYSFGASGPSAQATPPASLPLFTQAGFDLSWCIKKGGSFSPDALWMLLFTVRAVYLNSDVMSERVSNTLGAGGWRKIHSANPLAPDILAFNGRNIGVLYAIAGTTNLLQWVQYLLQFDQVPVGAGTGRIFSTFNDVGNGIYASIAADYAAHGNGGPVLFVGHSLGGALADYIGKRFYTFLNGATSGVVTYGAPRIGDEAYAAWPVVAARQTRPLFVRVYNDKDPIPPIIPARFCRAPDGDFTGVIKCVPVKYRHTFGRWVKYFDANNAYPGNGISSDADASLKESFASVRWVGNGGDAGAHRVLRYAQLLQTWTGALQRFLPGALYGAYTTLASDLAALGV